MTLIPLSPIDHIFTGIGSYPIEFVFAYDRTIDPDRLGGTIEELVRHFPPIGSVLVKTSEHSYALEPSAHGVHFESTDSALPFGEGAARYDFLDPVNSVEGEPLTRIKLTQTPEGSVLGVSMSHAVGDGFSYFYFLSAWAKLFHGESILDPSHERQLLIPDAQLRNESLTPGDVLSDCGIFWDERRTATERKKMHWDRLLLSKEELGSLLREAQQDCDGRLSYNDVLSALLWKTYLEKWDGEHGDSPTFASCPVDVRRILKNFPRTYFGNAVCLATTSLDYDELAGAPLGVLASTIRSIIAGVDEEYARRSLGTLEALRAQQGLSVLEENHVIHPRSGILITNLSRLPIQDIEFDAGPPVAFDILTPAQRGAVVLPAAEGADVRVCYPV